MIIGVGVDLVDVARVERSLTKGLLQKVFSEGERAYAESHPKRRGEILAGRWAAKEALAKALGTGLRAEWPLSEIEVVAEESGRPTLRLGSRVAHLLKEGTRAHLSISHTATTATAFVVLEED